MITIIKRVVYKFVNERNYFKILYYSFCILYNIGLLKKNPAYKYHYFVKKLIQHGDIVIDMGANLGYYSHIFSRHIGSTGKLICIEPIKPFFEILQWSFKKSKKHLLYNYALGEEYKTIKMIIPLTKDGYIRTGLAHICTEINQTSEDIAYIFNVDMVDSYDFFKQFHRIDYIKCDIEGYEEYVFPKIQKIIDYHKPIIQIETWGTAQPVIFNLMNQLGYIRYTLHKKRLVVDKEDRESCDYIFLHKSKAESILHQLK